MAEQKIGLVIGALVRAPANSHPERPGLVGREGRFAQRCRRPRVGPDRDSRAQDDLLFLPDRCPGIRGYPLLPQGFSKDVIARRLLFTVERDGALPTAGAFAFGHDLGKDLDQVRNQAPKLPIGKVVSSCRDDVLRTRLTRQEGYYTIPLALLGSPLAGAIGLVFQSALYGQSGQVISRDVPDSLEGLQGGAVPVPATLLIIRRLLVIPACLKR